MLCAGGLHANSSPLRRRNGELTAEGWSMIASPYRSDRRTTQTTMARITTALPTTAPRAGKTWSSGALPENEKRTI